jgi:hypothetical protein
MVRERLLEQSPAVRMQLPQEKRLPRHAPGQSDPRGRIAGTLFHPARGAV